MNTLESHKESAPPAPSAPSGQAESWFARHPKKTLAITLLVCLVVMICITESILAYKNRAAGYIAGITRYIRLGEYAPSSTRSFQPPGTARRSISLQTDADGFIKPARIHEQPDIVLAFLGGSLAACRYLSETERLPFLTGYLLEKSSGLKINTYNGAKQGNNTLDSINILLNKLAPLKPTAVILLPGWEDIETVWRYGTFWPPHPPASPLVERQPSILNDLAGLLGYPVRVFLPNFHTALTAWYRPELLPPGQALQQLSRESAVKYEQLTPQLKRALEIFISACQARQIRPILVTAPLSGPAPGPGNTGMLTPQATELFIHFNQIIRELGLRHQVQVIDLAQQALPAEYFYDAFHLSEKGSAYGADLLAGALKSRLDPKTPDRSFN